MPRACDIAVIGVLLPPLQVYRKKKLGKEFWIDLLLWLIAFLFWIGAFAFLRGTGVLVSWIPFIFIVCAIVYCFSLEGVEIAANIFCTLIPPLGLWIGTKKCDLDILICFLLCFLFYIPGIIYAYFKV